MAFGIEPGITPVSIGAISTELYDPAPGSGESQKATVTVQVVMSNGSVKTRQFNLPDHVAAGTINQLVALAASLRTKANAEILPT